MRNINIKKEFPTDHITRAAGERLRELILEADANGESVTIDFSGVTIASTSFLDEGLAKLADLGWSAEKVAKQVSLKNLNPLDKRVLLKVSGDRWPKGKNPHWSAI
jgi:hypothetical protein